jgi:hypothetical protein
MVNIGDVTCDNPPEIPMLLCRDKSAIEPNGLNICKYIGGFLFVDIESLADVHITMKIQKNDIVIFILDAFYDYCQFLRTFTQTGSKRKNI